MPRKTRKGGHVGTYDHYAITYVHENQSHWSREDLNKLEEGFLSRHFLNSNLIM